MVGSRRPNRWVVESASTAGFKKRALVVSEKEIRVMTKPFGLRPMGILVRRPRRQGSAMNGSAKTAEPPLTPLPARKTIGVT